MKILFSGGGTLGPVTPLLAIRDVLKKDNLQAVFLWVGTKTGPEKVLVEEQGIPFTTISSGKWRRYISFWNIIDISRIAVGFFQSLFLLWRENPDVCISAGGFISVPIHWAAWFFGIPTWIHQQDVDIGLSNRIMAPFAQVITTALEVQTKAFSKKKVHWMGNPVRPSIVAGNKQRARKRFKLTGTLPVIFVTGGGTGSMRVNQLVAEAIQHLEGHAEVIHLFGRERSQDFVKRREKYFSYYHTYQFFTDEMADAYAVADIVISRGGFGTLTEIAALSKAAILIPKPGHQEENVAFLAKAGAAIFMDEQTSDGNYMAKVIRELLEQPDQQKQMGAILAHIMPQASKEKILEMFSFLQI